MSAENNEHIAQEQELWERMSTTEGRERAEVLDELSHIAYKKDNYTECLHLVDTSIGIYFKLGGADVYLKELIHLYKGMCHCYEHLKRFEDAAGSFEHLAGLYFIDEDHEGQIWATRAAARAWYEVKEWQKSLDGHEAATKLIDIDATPFSMGMDQLNIGMVLEKLDRYDDAVVTYLSARKLFKEAKNPAAQPFQLAALRIKDENSFEAVTANNIEQKFIEQYLEVGEDHEFSFKLIPCVFLMPDNECSIYNVRPKACREYPHTNRRRFQQIETVTIANTAICPATYNIMEALKNGASKDGYSEQKDKETRKNSEKKQ